MLENIEYNPIDKGTLRLNIKPLYIERVYFTLINVPKVRFKIILFETICADDFI